MNQHSRDALAARLAAHLDCTQDVVCRLIMQAIAEIGQPLAPAHLAALLQMGNEELRAYLVRVPDTEFDAHGNIVGWGITLLPTAHQFLLKEHPLFTWCAFDTVLFPPLLNVRAQVRSKCEASGQPITFVATAEGIANLTPSTSMLSLIPPAERCDCIRGTFCRQSLFFHSEEAAAPWLAQHPNAVLLSVEDAAAIGQIVAKMWPRPSVA